MLSIPSHPYLCIYIYIYLFLYYHLSMFIQFQYHFICWPGFFVPCPLQFFRPSYKRALMLSICFFMIVRRAFSWFCRPTVTKSIVPKNIKQNICQGWWWSCHLEELFHKRIEEKGVVPLIKITNFLSIICMHHLIFFDHFRHPSITEHITCGEQKHRGHHDACTFLAA